MKVGQENLPVTAVAMPFAPKPMSRPLSDPDLLSAFRMSEPFPPVVQLAGVLPDAIS